jgi:predicted nucleic acid-binding protein
MNFVVDTDVVSTFGKLRRLELLQGLLADSKFFITPASYDELVRARERGYDFIEYIFERRMFEVARLTGEESDSLESLQEERRSLGLAELEGIALCKHRGYIFVTHDRGAKKICDSHAIHFIDLSMILNYLLVKELLTARELRLLIDEIERTDRVVIKDKGDIFEK